MYVRTLYYLLPFGPAIAVGLLGLRAARSRDNVAWALYGDAATVLGWITAPLILVASPWLIAPQGSPGTSSGTVGVAAIALFCLARTSFSPEPLSLGMRAARLVSGAGMELGISAYLCWWCLIGRLDPESVAPSASLFIRVLWCAYVAQYLLGHTAGVKSRVLGPGELMDRIKEIASRRGAILEHVLVITRVPGYAQIINAVAVRGTTIVLFADLVSRLSKAEVDAVVEHEIGHIADERIWTIDSSLRYGCYLAMLALAYVAESSIRSLPKEWSFLLYVMWAAMFILPEVLSRAYGRKIERRANRNVAQLTEPLAAVSALYKLALLNHQPTSRPQWSRWISTHPCVDEEAEEIATRFGLTVEQLRQVYEQVQSELGGPNPDGYQLASSGSANAQLPSADQPVRRPGGFASCVSSGLSFTLSIVAAAGLMVLTIVIASELSGWLAVLTGFVGFFGCGLLIVLPSSILNRRTKRRLAKQICDHLVEKYGVQAVERSIVVDALLPEWADRDQPWQGALLEVSDGRLALMCEADSAYIPLDSKISVSHWTNPNSWGADARMVLIAYQQDDTVRSIPVRPLACSKHDAPHNWKELEKHVKGLIEGEGAVSTPLKEMPQARRRRVLKWSRRVPVAVAIYLAILLVADFLGRRNGGGLATRFIWWTVATLIGGSGLWAWVTQVHKPSKD